MFLTTINLISALPRDIKAYCKGNVNVHLPLPIQLSNYDRVMQTPNIARKVYSALTMEPSLHWDKVAQWQEDAVDFQTAQVLLKHLDRFML